MSQTTRLPTSQRLLTLKRSHHHHQSTSARALAFQGEAFMLLWVHTSTIALKAELDLTRTTICGI